MATAGQSVRVLSAFFVGVLLAGTCTRSSPGMSSDRPAAQAVPPDPSFVWGIPVDVPRAEESAREEIVIAAQTYELQDGEPPLVENGRDPMPADSFLEWAHGVCAPEEPRERGFAFTVRDRLTVGRRTFAIVSTPCLQSLHWPDYNHMESVVMLADGRVWVPSIAPWPAWAGEPRELDASVHTREVWNPGLELRDGELFLVTGLHSRGLGDGGWWDTFVFRDGEFELFERREREENQLVPEDVGSFPIVSPPDRRCTFEVELESPRRGVLVRDAGTRTTRVPFAVRDEGCWARYGTSIACGEPGLGLKSEYVVVAHDADWVVLRVDARSYEEREVFRTPRGCAL